MSTCLSSSPFFLYRSCQKMWALLVCLDSQLLHMSLEQNGLVTENCNHCSLIGFELCRFLCAIHWRGSITFHQRGHVRVWMSGIPVSWVPFTRLNECVEFNCSPANRMHAQWPSPCSPLQKNRRPSIYLLPGEIGIQLSVTHLGKAFGTSCNHLAKLFNHVKVWNHTHRC